MSSIDAPIERVWQLVADVNVPAQFSTEFLGAEWIDDVPCVGARFQGRNHHAALGGWETTSFVTRYEPPRAFGWAVTDPDQPVLDLVVRTGARTGWRQAPSGHSHGTGTLGAVDCDCGHARKGGADRRSPPPGVRDQHARHGRGNQASWPRTRNDPPRRYRRHALDASGSRADTRSRTARRRLRLGPRVLGGRRPDPAGLPRRLHLPHPSGHGDRAARRPFAGDAGHVRALTALLVGRSVRARRRNQRTSGHGGLARCSLR